jgi:alkylhydroperoxidase family enzyme
VLAVKLPRIERGEGLLARLRLGVTAMRVRERVPDVMRVLSYRPELFGRAFGEYASVVLHGPGSLGVGEREALAAWYSARLGCEACAAIHRLVATHLLGPERAAPVLLFRSGAAPPEGLSVELHAALELLEALAAMPERLGRAEVEQALEAGLSREDVELLGHLAALCTTMSTLTGVLGCAQIGEQGHGHLAALVLERGYRP